MTDFYIGEIRTISFNFPPTGWAFCNGQTLPINQNQALFSILGTWFGGNGVTTFCLPDLRGRMPIHQGSSYLVGEAGGEESHTLTINEMPTHLHPAMAASTVTGPSPNGTTWGPSPSAGEQLYAPSPSVAMSPGALGLAGGSQPHENRPPFLVLNFIIALTGIYPSRS